MADPASTSLRVIRSLVGKADDAPRVIRAYHGSPHSFPRFDASKIGTGEGVQAYGHGLYFAGDEAVARHYRDILAEDEELPIPWPLSSDYAQAYQNYLDLSTKAGEWSRLNTGGGAAPPNPYKKPLDEASALWQDLRRQVDAATKRPGHMYEVQIDYPEEALLDLDAPVGGQSQAVRDALSEFARAPLHFTFGQEGWRGKNAYMSVAEQGASQAEASRVLRERGIPGLRYWDGNSRTSGRGTQNYVMFPGTEDRIKILRQYGLLPPLLAPALMEDE